MIDIDGTVWIDRPRGTIRGTCPLAGLGTISRITLSISLSTCFDFSTIRLARFTLRARIVSVSLRLVRPRMMLSWRILQVEDLVSVFGCWAPVLSVRIHCIARRMQIPRGEWLGKWHW